jgi:hypothetical protein
MVVQEDFTLDQLHHQFGHISETRLQALIKSMGMSMVGSMLSSCCICVEAKVMRKAIDHGPAP